MTTSRPDDDIDAAIIHLGAAASHMERLADTLDAWAEQSRSCGWSTHQVSANLDEANALRRRASQARAAIAKARGDLEPRS